MNVPVAPIGHNAPPDPFEAYNLSIGDLLLEANNFLDGKAIETEEQEAAVASILTRLRREANAADEQRKAEKKVHDEAAAAVQAKWKPLLSKAGIAVDTCKNALTSFLRKKDEAQRAAAEAARQEAERLAEAAAQTARTTNPEDLCDQTTLRIRQENAADAQKRADKLSKAKPQARGGEKAVGLRTYYRAEITDPVAFARWVWANRRGEMMTFLEVVAERESRGGDKHIPGLTVHTERKAA